MLSVSHAQPDDLPLVLSFIQALADYEQMSERCTATLDGLRATLFCDKPDAEVLIARINGVPAGFALYCHGYSTFLARRGIHLEDLFVHPEFRGKQVGYSLLAALARIAVERECWGVEWAVLDWNQLAIDFYERIGARGTPEWVPFRLTGESLLRMAGAAPPVSRQG